MTIEAPDRPGSTGIDESAYAIALRPLAIGEPDRIIVVRTNQVVVTPRAIKRDEDPEPIVVVDSGVYYEVGDASNVPYDSARIYSADPAELE